MSLELIFRNNRNEVININGTTSRVSVTTEGMTYQFERELGSNVVKCVGSNNSFEITPDRVLTMDQDFIIHSECRSSYLPRRTEFQSVGIPFRKRKRAYDMKKLADKEITSKDVERIFSDLDCDHLFGNFHFVAHMADCLGIAHTGMNSYSEEDTIRACCRIAEYPLTFEALKKSLNVSDAYLDMALRKLDRQESTDSLKICLKFSKVYNSRPIELFSPKILDKLREITIDAAPDTIRYVTAKDMATLLRLRYSTDGNTGTTLARLGIRPSKRVRGRYILAEAQSMLDFLSEYKYSVIDIQNALGISHGAVHNYIRDGIIPKDTYKVIPGMHTRYHFTGEAIASAYAHIVRSGSRLLVQAEAARKKYPHLYK